MSTPVGSRRPRTPSPKVISATPSSVLADDVDLVLRAGAEERRHLEPEDAADAHGEGRGDPRLVARGGRRDVGERALGEREGLARQRGVAGAEHLGGHGLAARGLEDVAVDGQGRRQRPLPSGARVEGQGARPRVDRARDLGAPAVEVLDQEAPGERIGGRRLEAAAAAGRRGAERERGADRAGGDRGEPLPGRLAGAGEEVAHGERAGVVRSPVRRPRGLPAGGVDRGVEDEAGRRRLDRRRRHRGRVAVGVLDVGDAAGGDLHQRLAHRLDPEPAAVAGPFLDHDRVAGAELAVEAVEHQAGRAGGVEDGDAAAVSVRPEPGALGRAGELQAGDRGRGGEVERAVERDL